MFFVQHPEKTPWGQSAIDSAQNDETMVLQSLQAANQANRMKIIHLLPGFPWIRLDGRW